MSYVPVWSEFWVMSMCFFVSPQTIDTVKTGFSVYNTHSVQSRSEALTGPNDGPGLGWEGRQLHVGEEQRVYRQGDHLLCGLGKSKDRL